jgi:hypothetical protein
VKKKFSDLVPGDVILGMDWEKTHLNSAYVVNEPSEAYQKRHWTVNRRGCWVEFPLLVLSSSATSLMTESQVLTTVGVMYYTLMSLAEVLTLSIEDEEGHEKAEAGQ